jgi:penicillin-binding protein 1A
MVKIDRRTGKRVFDGTPSDEPLADVIWEAFKPDTEPTRSTRMDELAAMRSEILDMIRRARASLAGDRTEGRDDQPSDFVEDQGGIY